MRAKAYCDLTQHHNSVSNDNLAGQGGSSTRSTEIAEAEENFRKSVSNLVSTVVTKGAKVSGERGAALISSIIHLVPPLPLKPSANTSHRSATQRGMECRIILGDVPRSVSARPTHHEFSPQFTFNWGTRCTPTVAGSSTIKFGQAMTRPIASTQPGYPFFKQPASTPILTPQKGCRTPYATQLSLVERIQCIP